MNDSRPVPDPAQSAAEQLVEHVRADGSVIEIVSRSEMRARTLRHRSVGVVVVDGSGRLLVHRRADWKDVFPGAWDLAFGGVCDVGESYLRAAHRELAEEAGIEAELVDLGPYSFEASDVAVVGRLFGCVHTGPFRFDDGEVTDTAWVAVEELEQFVADNVVPSDSEALVTAAAIGSLAGSSVESSGGPASAGAGRGGVESVSGPVSQASSPQTAAGLESAARPGEWEGEMKIDLSAASVRPTGTQGVAARTALGFVVVASADGGDIIGFVDGNQRSGDLIERLVDHIEQTRPSAAAMLFTAGGEPYLLSWGTAVTDLHTASAVFSLVAAEDQVLVHPLAVDAETRIEMRTDRGERSPSAAVIELAHGSMPADAVTIELAPSAPVGAASPSAASTADLDRSPPEPVQPPAVTAAATGNGAGSAVVPALPDPEPVLPLTAPDHADPDPASTEPVLPLTAPDHADHASTEPVLPLTEAPMSIVEPSDGMTWIEAPNLRADQPATQDQPAPAPQIPPRFDRPETTSSPAPAPAPPPTPVIGPAMVLGITCENGHHNHPDSVYCSQCGARIGSQQTSVMVNGPRPPLGVLIVDDGTTHAISHDLVIGRDPGTHPDVKTGAAMAIALSDPSLALSRRHARIVLNGWVAYVTDLDSSNGTWLNRGANPQDWRRVSSDMTETLQAGDRIRVGGRSLQVELHSSG